MLHTCYLRVPLCVNAMNKPTTCNLGRHMCLTSYSYTMNSGYKYRIVNISINIIALTFLYRVDSMTTGPRIWSTFIHTNEYWFQLMGQLILPAWVLWCAFTPNPIVDLLNMHTLFEYLPFGHGNFAHGGMHNSQVGT